MSIKTFVSAVFAAFVGFLPAVSMAGVVYDAELVNPWFAAGVTNLSNAGGVAVTITEPPTENWTLPLEGEVVATNQLLKFEADALAPLVYTPDGEGSVVSVVNVHLFVEPNVMMPDTNGMDLAQAALTVVTNAANENLDWVGLVRCDATNAWVRLSGDIPVAGAEYDVQIVIDNGDSKKICYLVKGPEADEFTPLTLDEAMWLDNPKQTESSVSAVAFAGVGTIGEFSGTQIFDDGAGIGELVNGAGFDFTNGTVKAVVTLPSVNASGSTRTATLKVVDFATGEAHEYERTVQSGAYIIWNLPDLRAGGTYSYTLTVESGDAVRAEKSGTFVAGNWLSGGWFSAVVVNGEGVCTNGEWIAADLNVEYSRWDIASNAVFAVDSDKVPAGSNSVAYVDTVYAFSTFTDLESLESLEGAIGGIVAVSDGGGSWCAFTGDGENGWSLLSGGVTPAVNTEFVVRAEFDFLSDSKRVRYFVSSDGGETFSLLTCGGDSWLPLADDAKATLSSVGMSGSGYVKSIYADIADKSIAADSTGKKFATLWDAIRNGEGPITLLTNATLKPEGVSKTQQPFAINSGSFGIVKDLSGLSGKWTLVYNENDGLWYLTKAGATYIFF